MDRSIVFAATCALVGVAMVLGGCRSREGTKTDVRPPSIAPDHQETTPFGVGGGPHTDGHVGVGPRTLWYGVPLRCALPPGARHRAAWCDELPP
jgi:hypothetical protein